jgi:hypothetical protein
VFPELSPAIKFSYSSQKAVNEYKEGKEVKIVLFPVFSYNTLFCCGVAVTICVPVVGLKLGSS